MTVAVCSPDEIKSGMFSNKIAGLWPKRSTTFGFDCLRVLRLASLTWHQRLCESLSLASHSNWCLQTWQQCKVTCCRPHMFCLHPKGCSSSSLECYLFVVYFFLWGTHKWYFFQPWFQSSIICCGHYHTSHKHQQCLEAYSYSMNGKMMN